MALAVALELVKRLEGLRLTAYPDPASGGDPWTIGYGATGPGIIRGTRWTLEQADADLAARLAVLERQVAALVSFAYNVGVDALKRSSLLRLLNGGKPSAAAAEFAKWTKASGKVFPGLVKRREAERRVFVEVT